MAQEGELLNQVSLTAGFVGLDHLPSQRIQGDLGGAPIFILVTSGAVRATERGHCFLGIDGCGCPVNIWSAISSVGLGIAQIAVPTGFSS